MNRQFLAGLAFFLAIVTSNMIIGQQQQNWPVVSVQVFEQGARIERQGMVELDADGNAVINISGLATGVQADMVQISLEDGWSLVSNVFKVKPIGEDAATTKKMDELDEAIELNRQTNALREALTLTYEEELTMIQSNRQVGGNELLLVEDLLEHANFWRERVKELQYMLLELRMEMEELALEWNDLYQERNALEEKANRTEGVMTLRFSGPPRGKATLALTYVATDAYWRPMYDAVVDESGDIVMTRYASVQQRTGNDWEGIPIVFMAGNPLTSIQPPPVVQKQVTLGGNAVGYDYAWAPSEDLFEDDFKSSEFISFGEPTGSIERYEFEAKKMARVKGDGTRERIFLEQFQLEGEINYLLLPEYTDEGYQLVSSADWTASKLMPGTVQVITNGTFRGAFDMTLPAPGDTLLIPLSQDPQVRSSRNRQMDQCSSKIFGGSKKTIQTFEIIVENQHSRAVKLKVQDAIPTSNSTDIQIQALELDGGNLDPLTGEISWEFTLDPMQQRRLVFGFEVTYPKKRTLVGL